MGKNGDGHAIAFRRQITKNPTDLHKRRKTSSAFQQNHYRSR